MSVSLSTRQKIGLAKAVQRPIIWARSLVGMGHDAKVTRNGIAWHLDLWEGIDFAIFLQGAFEPSTARALKHLISPGDTVLDIGANIGAHTLAMAESVGDTGRLLAFEPTEYAFSKLTRNIALNPSLAERISAFQTMLVERDTAALEEKISSSWPLRSSDDLHQVHRAREMTTAGAAARALDSILAEQNISKVDCIKIDVDGHETKVFRGARETLATHSPVIVMELAPYALEEFGSNIRELLSLLREAGYAFYSETTNQKYSDDDAELVRHIPDGGSINVIARSGKRGEP